MEAFQINIEKEGPDFVVFGFTGYLAAKAGADLKEQSGGFLRAKKFHLILDLSGCSIIASPGVAALMDVAMEARDDFQGGLVLVGLDPVKTQFLRMVGLIPLAWAFPDVATALKELDLGKPA